MKRPILFSRIVALSALLWVPKAMAASFNVTGNDSSTKSLSSGQTGTVSSTGNLSVSGSNVTVTATGASTITNSGTIKQTGTAAPSATTPADSSSALRITRPASCRPRMPMSSR